MEGYSEATEKLVSDLAIGNYKNGLNCCESVFNALLRAGALPDTDPRSQAMCLGFGGGIGLSGYVCGALSGAVMANGAKYGRPDPYAVEPEEKRMKEISQRLYMRYNNMICDFIEENGSALCIELCGKYEDPRSRERKVGCLKLIGKTAAMAYRYLQVTEEEAEKLPYRDLVFDRLERERAAGKGGN